MERDISRDPQAIDELVSMGATGTPFLKVGDRTMLGFREEELREWLGL